MVVGVVAIDNKRGFHVLMSLAKYVNEGGAFRNVD